MKKDKELKDILVEINKDNNSKHQTIPTLIKSLDYVFVGGITLGGKYQIVAESSSGKSTLALQIAKNFCSRKYNVLYVDTENSITDELLTSTGCKVYLKEGIGDVGQLVVLKESNFDDVSSKLDICIKSKYFSLIIIDSIASLVNNCYVDIHSNKGVKAITNNNTNYESRPLNLFINKYSCLANEYNIALLYINQYRNKVDPIQGTVLKAFGNKAVHYNSDVIIKMKKEKQNLWQDENGIFNNDEKSNYNVPATHSKITFTVDKSNKILSGTEVSTYLKFGCGVDEYLDDYIEKIRTGKIEKNGKYYNFQNSIEKYDSFLNLVNSSVLKDIKDKIDDDDDDDELW